MDKSEHANLLDAMCGNAHSLFFSLDVKARKKLFKKAGLPTTIGENVLLWWKLQGRVCHYSDLAAQYLRFSRLLGYYARRDYIGMNVTRLLKKHGIKTDVPGSRAPWVLRTNV